MGVEGGDFVHLGLGQPHLVGKGGEMRGGKMPEFILYQVKVLDQKVTAARPVTQQVANLKQGPVLNLTPFRRHSALSPAILPDTAAAIQWSHVTIPP